jgi:tRNA (guanine37-N1)-methyltransferase
MRRRTQKICENLRHDQRDQREKFYACSFIQYYICAMKIDILTVLPELLESPFAHSILKRAKEKKLLEINVHNLRNWAVNEYGQVDDYQYGGGAGMVMMCEPLANAIESLSKQNKFDEIIFMTPYGEKFTQKIANQLSLKENILII